MSPTRPIKREHDNLTNDIMSPGVSDSVKQDTSINESNLYTFLIIKIC